MAATSPEARLTALLEMIRSESDSLLQLLPGAHDAQWHKGRPPVRTGPEPEDAGIRSKGKAPADPTGDAVVDTARLRVRADLLAADRHAIQALALIRGTRAALERSLARWEGETDRNETAT